MKRVLYFVVMPAIFLAGVLMVFLAITREKPEADVKLAFADSLRATLPADDTSARRVLQLARKEMERITPDKPYIVIDTHGNRIFMRTADSILLDASCSTGSGGELIDSVTGRKWIFNTPRGVFKIKNKLKQPWWRKPDWAFIEENEPIPKKEEERYDPNVMGDYAMGFGDGFFIHGTIYERLLGINVTHGCVRVGTDDLQRLWDLTPVGTSVYIF